MSIVYTCGKYGFVCPSYEEPMTFDDFRNLMTQFISSKKEFVKAVRKLAPGYALKADRTLSSQDHKTYMTLKTKENACAIIFIDAHELGVVVFAYFITPADIPSRIIGMLFPWRSNWRDCARHILEALHIVMPDKSILPRCAAFYEVSYTSIGFKKP